MVDHLRVVSAANRWTVGLGRAQSDTNHQRRGLSSARRFCFLRQRDGRGARRPSRVLSRVSGNGLERTCRSRRCWEQSRSGSSRPFGPNNVREGHSRGARFIEPGSVSRTSGTVATQPRPSGTLGTTRRPSVARAAWSRGWLPEGLRPRCSRADGLHLSRESRTGRLFPWSAGSAIVRNAPRRRMVVQAQLRTPHVPVERLARVSWSGLGSGRCPGHGHGHGYGYGHGNGRGNGHGYGSGDGYRR